MSPSFFRFVVDQWSTVPTPTMPLDGKTALITGSNQGLGFEAARHLLRLNVARLIIACRNVKAGNEAKQSLLASLPDTKTTIEVWDIDLATFGSVRSFAERANAELDRLDIAILNAALATVSYSVSPEGWESTLQVNVLSTAYLALLLLPKLLSSSSSPSTVEDSGAFKPHLTIITSEVHFRTPFRERDEPNTLQYLNEKEKANMMDRYQISKLYDVYVTRAIADYVTAHGGGKVVVNCVNPGFCHSSLRREFSGGVLGLFMWIFERLMCRSTEAGARTLAYGGTQNGTESHGKYLNICKVEPPSAATVTPELTQKVWKEIGEVLVKQDPGLKQYF